MCPHTQTVDMSLMVKHAVVPAWITRPGVTSFCTTTPAIGRAHRQLRIDGRALMLRLVDFLLRDAENLQRLQVVLHFRRCVVVILLGGFQIFLRDHLVIQQILAAVEGLLGIIQAVARLLVGGDRAGDVGAGYVQQRLVRRRRMVPVSTRRREIGPLTCVIACVVWSASQSTVPVVRTAGDQTALCTSAIFRCSIWFCGT